jgi:Rrf2 family protein
MKISKKCQYALRAIFELASRNREVPVKVREIARAQRISTRFLEVILNELKHSGFVESRRGNEGGYILNQEPEKLTIAEVLETVEGRVTVNPNGSSGLKDHGCFGDAAFGQLWQEATDAVSEVFASKTFADLVEFERKQNYASVPNYNI